MRQLVARFVNEGALGYTDPSAAWAWVQIVSNDRPTTLTLRTEASRLGASDPLQAGITQIIEAPDYRHDQYVKTQVVEWARRQTFRRAFEESRSAWNADQHDKAMEIMQSRMDEIQRIRLDGEDRGWFFEEFDMRQERRAWVDHELDYFPLGIDPIDERMYGGLSFGELEIPFSYSGIGKSFYCVHRGFVAARLKRQVLHFILEGGRAKIEDRYEARLTETMYRHVRRGQFEAPGLKRVRREYETMRRGLVVRGFADDAEWRISIQQIRAELLQLREQDGWVPELILVDYGDLVHAEGKDDRERQKSAFRQLKSLAEHIEFRGHRGYAVCAPSQAVRPDKGADEREHVLYPRDVADCYEKTRIADAVISINRTAQEKNHQVARLYLGKYRDNEDNLLVRIATDYAKGCFAKLGVSEPPPPPPPPLSGAP